MHKLHHLLHRLAEAGVDFVLVGGFAGVLHGSSLPTSNVEVCVMLSAENTEKIRGALADLHPFHRQTHERLSFADHPAHGQALPNLYLETDDGIIDILSSILGVGDFARLKERAQNVPLFGRTCAVISLGDLIAAKLAVGREKDLLAVKELRAIAAMSAQNKDFA